MTFWPVGGKAGIHSLPPLPKEEPVVTQTEMDELLRDSPLPKAAQELIRQIKEELKDKE